MSDKHARPLKAAVFTMSDRGAMGEREDLSGPAVIGMLEGMPAEVVAYKVLPDDAGVIKAKLIELADAKGVDVIVTTGGTGVSPRDVTPEATRAVIDRELPGMSEAMRAESLKKTPHAMLSRAVRSRAVPSQARQRLSFCFQSRSTVSALRSLKGEKVKRISTSRFASFSNLGRSAAV